MLVGGPSSWSSSESRLINLILCTRMYNLKGSAMMRVPHRLGIKVLSVIYMALQFSLY